MFLCRVGDIVLGLVCMLLLLVLKLMRDHVPPIHPEMPPGVRLSHGLVWTATTGEGLPWVRTYSLSSTAQPGLTPGDVLGLISGHSERLESLVWAQLGPWDT